MSDSNSSGSGRFWLLIFIVLAVFSGLFVLGYMPRRKQEKARNAEVRQLTKANPTVTVAKAKAAPDTTTVTEAVADRGPLAGPGSQPPTNRGKNNKAFIANGMIE